MPFRKTALSGWLDGIIIYSYVPQVSITGVGLVDGIFISLSLSIGNLLNKLSMDHLLGMCTWLLMMAWSVVVVVDWRSCEIIEIGMDG